MQTIVATPALCQLHGVVSMEPLHLCLLRFHKMNYWKNHQCQLEKQSHYALSLQHDGASADHVCQKNQIHCASHHLPPPSSFAQ